MKGVHDDPAVLNKYDRATGKTTTLPLDPKSGAHPLGPLLDLGNGQAIARVLAAAPAPNPKALKAYEGVGGYAGGPGMLASQQGYAWFDLKTKQMLRSVSQDPAITAFSQERVKLADADQGTIFEVDKGVADADLCKAKPVITSLVSGLSDVPSTRIFSLKSGSLVYGTSNGKLMKLDPAAKSVALLADLRTANAASSVVRGYLAEAKENVLAVIVFDYDAGGRNTARRLVTVDVLTAKQSRRDVFELMCLRRRAEIKWQLQTT